MTEKYSIGTVFLFIDSGLEAVVVHNRKLPGDICLLSNISCDLNESFASFDEWFIDERISSGEWKIK